MFSEILLDDAKNFNTKIKWAMKLKIKKVCPKFILGITKKTMFVAVNTRRNYRRNVFETAL